jgi:hypothetical protein
MAKLKVFRWSDGFHAYTVATSSRARALQAWGFSRDLFKDGSAIEVTDGPDYDAALAKPGELIERGLSVDVGEARPVKAPKAKGPSKADRARVDKLEAELQALDERQASEQQALDARRAALETEAEAADRRHASERRKLLDRLKAARARL